jgi:hypothetical protein
VGGGGGAATGDGEMITSADMTRSLVGQTEGPTGLVSRPGSTLICFLSISFLLKVSKTFIGSINESSHTHAHSDLGEPLLVSIDCRYVA